LNKFFHHIFIRKKRFFVRELRPQIKGFKAIQPFGIQITNIQNKNLKHLGGQFPLSTPIFFGFQAFTKPENQKRISVSIGAAHVRKHDISANVALF